VTGFGIMNLATISGCRFGEYGGEAMREGRLPL